MVCETCERTYKQIDIHTYLHTYIHSDCNTSPSYRRWERSKNLFCDIASRPVAAVTQGQRDRSATQDQLVLVDYKDDQDTLDLLGLKDQ